jgi:hypothetical protein
MFNQNNIPTFGKTASFLVLFAVAVFLITALFAAVLTPLTFLWSVITGKSYSAVCDSSEFIYKMNQLGIWTLAFLAGLAILLMLF